MGFTRQPLGRPPILVAALAAFAAVPVIAAAVLFEPPPRPAAAQSAGCVVGVQCVLLQSYVPVAEMGALAATSVSSATALPATGGALGLRLTNVTGTTAWALLGASTVVAGPSAPSTPIPPWATVWVPIGYATTVAVATASGTASVLAEVGSGAPLLVSGLVQPAPPLPLAYAGPDSASVATTSGQLWAAGAYSRTVRVCTLPASSTNVWLNLRGAAAAVGAGTEVPAAGGCAPTLGGPDLPLPIGAVDAINDGGGAQTVTLTGG